MKKLYFAIFTLLLVFLGGCGNDNSNENKSIRPQVLLTNDNYKATTVDALRSMIVSKDLDLPIDTNQLLQSFNDKLKCDNNGKINYVQILPTIAKMTFEQCMIYGYNLTGDITLKQIDKNTQEYKTSELYAKTDSSEITLKNSTVRISYDNNAKVTKVNEHINGSLKLSDNRLYKYNNFRLITYDLTSNTVKVGFIGDVSTPCIDNKWVRIKSQRDLTIPKGTDCPTSGLAYVYGKDDSRVKTLFNPDTSIDMALIGGDETSYSNCYDMLDEGCQP